MPSSHLILCHPLFLLPPVPPSIRVFSNESTLCMRWPKYWSFSFTMSPSNEHLGLIFRMDWLDLLAVQGTLKSLLQHHSSKASILQHSAFFTVQLSHPYMTTGKTIALTYSKFILLRSENNKTLLSNYSPTTYKKSSLEEQMHFIFMKSRFYLFLLVFMTFVSYLRKYYLLLVASVRNSAHGKCHEEGGLAYAKA